MRVLPTWLRDRLWRQRDWPVALEREVARLAAHGDRRATRALELGRACEHIHPDRRRAVAAYAAAGPGRDGGRAREIAVELGWWPALARLAVTDRATAPGLAREELLAWLDGGEPVLAATILAEARAAHPDDLEVALLADALSGGDARAGAARLSAAGEDRDDAELLVGAARLARLGGDGAGTRRHLTAALARAPGHRRATALLLDATSHDEGGMREMLQALLADLDLAEWLDRVRAIGTRLATRHGTRGLGLRLLRHALDRAYTSNLDVVPGHLAMWNVLVDHGRESGSRHELMALARIGLELSGLEDDRVWLTALGTDVAWRDDGDLEAAKAWAGALAELAPSHPAVADVHRTATTAGADPSDALVYLDAATAAIAAAAAAVEELEELDELDQADDLEDADEPAEPDDGISIDVDDGDGGTAEAGAAPTSVVHHALDAAERAASAPPTPPSGLIPRAAMGALRTLPGKPPALPVRAAPVNAHPRATRVEVPLDAVIVTAEGTSHVVVCRDISATGIFVLTETSLPLGENVELVVRTPTGEPWREQHHRARARVVRRESRGYGLELVEPPASLRDEIARLTPR